jgi:hypothetical protein
MKRNSFSGFIVHARINPMKNGDFFMYAGPYGCVCNGTDRLTRVRKNVLLVDSISVFVTISLTVFPLQFSLLTFL